MGLLSLLSAQNWDVSPNDWRIFCSKSQMSWFDSLAQMFVIIRHVVFFSQNRHIWGLLFLWLLKTRLKDLMSGFSALSARNSPCLAYERLLCSTPPTSWLDSLAQKSDIVQACFVGLSKVNIYEYFCFPAQNSSSMRKCCLFPQNWHNNDICFSAQKERPESICCILSRNWNIWALLFLCSNQCSDGPCRFYFQNRHIWVPLFLWSKTEIS